MRRRELGVGAEVARATGDHARAQRAQQHRHVEALDLGETLDVRVDQVGEAVEVGGATTGPERRPGREGVLRRLERQVRLARAAARDLGERLLVDRRDVQEPVGARDALAADVVIGRDRDERCYEPGARARRRRARG